MTENTRLEGIEIEMKITIITQQSHPEGVQAHSLVSAYQGNYKT